VIARRRPDRHALCFAARHLARSAAATPTTRRFPVSGEETVLPAGTELDDDALDRLREIFNSEAMGGGKSYLINLGDLAFTAPSILVCAARQSGISCAICHVNGASNPKLYVPGMSSRAGNFDTSGALFNPRADWGQREPRPRLQTALPLWLGPCGALLAPAWRRRCAFLECAMTLVPP
jgi:hypothetical protein